MLLSFESRRTMSGRLGGPPVLSSTQPAVSSSSSSWSLRNAHAGIKFFHPTTNSYASDSRITSNSPPLKSCPSLLYSKKPCRKESLPRYAARFAPTNLLGATKYQMLASLSAALIIFDPCSKPFGFPATVQPSLSHKKSLSANRLGSAAAWASKLSCEAITTTFRIQRVKASCLPIRGTILQKATYSKGKDCLWRAFTCKKCWCCVIESCDGTRVLSKRIPGAKMQSAAEEVSCTLTRAP
mmetsp:Transcript_33084/g.68285  ORF Transcript_33084/g.68285 Transcript_33084/m.68285 type:complete len:240 (-) Transcript_33084:7-726(-)